MYHPWIWLNEPQHSAAVQAVTGSVATVAAIFAGGFALGAYRAAKTQAEAAQEQTRLAREMAKNERRRYEEEKQRVLAERISAFEIKKAQEDAVRPKFQTGAYTYAPSISIDFTNVGGSPAMDVKFLTPDDKEIYRRAYIREGSSTTVPVERALLEEVGYIVVFRTQFGSWWRVRVFGAGTKISPTEQIIGIERPYAL